MDDYAHHPTEIEATLQTAHQKYPDREIVAIFQPHTFTRTAALLNEFADSLATADHVYLCDIFGSAREKAGNLTIDDLINKIPGAKHLILMIMNHLNLMGTPCTSLWVLVMFRNTLMHSNLIWIKEKID